MDIRAKLQMNAKNQKEAQIKSELLQMERKGNISNERLMVPIFCKTHCKILWNIVKCSILKYFTQKLSFLKVDCFPMSKKSIRFQGK